MTSIIALIVVALVLFFFEILIPGGLFALVGGILMIVASILAHNAYGIMAALGTLIGSILLAILMLALELKLLRDTRLGQKFFLQTANKETSLKPQADEEVIGKEGKAFTRLNPTGIVWVEGREYEAFSQKGLLEKGTPIKVINQDTFRLIVDKL